MAPTADRPDPTSNSGIRKLSNGESVIPSSTRADGSVRREIRVKPGYKPPEDVELYKNRTAAAWKNRGKASVPGAQVVGEDAAADKPTSAAAKNAKRKEARKRAAVAAAADADADDTGSLGLHADDAGTVAYNTPQSHEPEPEPADPEAEKAKEARKLAKKLRQARELRDKKDNGGDLLPEQFAKVIKINELIRQLDSLGFDTEGEKKMDKTEAAVG